MIGRTAQQLFYRNRILSWVVLCSSLEMEILSRGKTQNPNSFLSTNSRLEESFLHAVRMPSVSCGEQIICTLNCFSQLQEI